MNKAKMKESTSLQLDAPRFENGKALVIAGLRSRYTSETMNGIPAQWERFVPYIGKIPGQVGRAAYGVCWNFAGGIEYLTGVEVSNSSDIPGEFNVVDIPAQNTLFSPTVNTYPNYVKRSMPSGAYGFRNLVMRSLGERLMRPTSSSGTPRNSIRGPEWAARRFGYQSNREGN